MTGPGDVSRETSTAWQQYLNREHAARDMYLRITARAHHEYLGGPWPDRDAYLMVEREAYATYYQAGRHAWNIYRATMETPPPQPTPKPAASHPYPLPARSNNYDALGFERPAFTPHPGNEPGDDNLFNRITERGEYPYPKNGALDQFDERQETYLAADPETRDNQ